MSWTATLISADKDDRNPQNIKAVVRLSDGVETFDVIALGNDLDDTSLKRWLHTIIARNLAERDIALPKIKALIGQPVTVEAPPPPTALDQAKQAVRAIIGIQQVKGAVTDAAIVTACTNRSNTLQAQLKTFMTNNPSVNIEDLF